MENIISENATQQFKKDYQRYGIYITFRRVMPDYKDGFKPVQRRVLWAMYNDSKAVSKSVKCATIIGDVMGKYHAHGDSSIYMTMKPMANWFESYLTTIEPQGNLGTMQGNEPSAYRYTEAKVSQFAIDNILDDLKESKYCVDWEDNFDNTLKEPAYLPVKIPLLLINGTFGIGLGKKTEIPTHNTNEVIDATIALMRDPSIEITLIPDHCMRCEIINSDFKTISRTGYGYYTVRGVIEHEKYKNKDALIIKGTPNLVFLNDIEEKIQDLVEKKKLVQIADAFDESEGNDMRYVILLKPGADPEYVKQSIYKYTPMEKTERVNFEVLDDLSPIRMSYKSYLLSFIDHRKTTKYRVYKNKLQDIQTRHHEIELYIKAIESGEIDAIVNWIKNQKGTDDTPMIEYLIKKLNVTDKQAKFLLNSPIKRLSKGYLAKYKEEYKELTRIADSYKAILSTPALIEQEIIRELEEAKAKYGHRRICKVIKTKGAVVDVPKGAMTIAISGNNMIKKVPAGTYLGKYKGDYIKSYCTEDNSKSILVFDTMGKVYKLPVDKIPFVDRNSPGTDIRFLIKGITSDIVDILQESTVECFGNKDNVDRCFITVLTKSGLIKKMDLNTFLNVPPSGLLYTRVEDGDYVISVDACDMSQSYLVFSDRKAMNMPVSTISTMKRNSKGNKTFRAGNVDGMINIIPDGRPVQYLLVVTASGRANKVPIGSIPNINTPKKSFSLIKLNKGDSIVGIIPCDDNSTVAIHTSDSFKKVTMNELHVGSSISIGDKVIGTKTGKVVFCSKLPQ